MKKNEIPFINKNFVSNGIIGLIHLKPNMDTLLVLGILICFFYSIIAALIILAMVILCKLLMNIGIRRADEALKSLIKHMPKTAVIVDSYGKEKEVPIEEIGVSDIFVVRPGENVPVDGIVVEGNASVNEAVLTGESTFVDKGIGACVLAATTNNSGYLKCRATRVGSDTALSRIINMVSEAAYTKAPIFRITDKITAIFVPVVIGIAVLSFFIWFIITNNPIFALERVGAVLVTSCPCALVLATPLAIMVGGGVGARNGIIFKTAASLENASKSQIVAINKTGTITRGEPVVTDVFTVDAVTRSGYSLINTSENELLKLAGLLERKSDHPLARAVVSYVGDLRAYYEDLDEEDEDITDFEILPGHGIRGRYMGHEVVGASLKYINQITNMQPEVREKAIGLAGQGKTPICFAKDNKLIGIIAVEDPLKKDSADAIKELKGMGCHVVTLTGDNVRTAMAIGDQAGVDETASEILPDGKEAVVKYLSKYGRVLMVGDGINDAKALERADIGMAIGAVEEVSIEEADVVLMKNSLMDVSGAIRLSRATISNIRVNLIWTAVFNLVGILLASGALSSFLSWQLSPVIGAAAMCLSNLLVVANALRLNFVDIRDNSKDRALKSAVEGELLQDYSNNIDNTESV